MKRLVKEVLVFRHLEGDGSWLISEVWGVLGRVWLMSKAAADVGGLVGGWEESYTVSSFMFGVCCEKK